MMPTITDTKRKGATTPRAMLIAQIEALDREIHTCRKGLAQSQTERNRSSRRVNKCFVTAQTERALTDSARAAQKMAPGHKARLEEIAHLSTLEAEFFEKAPARSMGAEPVLKEYRRRASRAREKAAEAQREAEQYKHVKFHRFDMQAIEDYSVAKEAYNEASRQATQFKRELEALMKARRQLVNRLKSL